MKSKSIIHNSLFVILIFFGIFGLAKSSWAACRGSSPTWTSTTDYSSVNTCVSLASSGDTINIYPGSSTWDTQLTITKGNILRGAGASSTFITSAISGDYFVVSYQPATPTLNKPFRITGFNFNMNSVSSGILLSNRGSATLTKIRIDHNTFSNETATGNHMCTIEDGGRAWGVVNNNTFSGPKTTLQHFGHNSGDWTYSTFTCGDGSGIYYEDNTFTHNDTPVAGGQGSRYVSRYNTFIYTNTAGLFPWFDAHGNQGAGINAMMGVEIYGNVITASNMHWGNNLEALSHRGGKALFFFTKVASSLCGATIQIMEEFPGSSSPPETNPISGEPQHVSDAYYWNDRVDTALMGAPVVCVGAECGQGDATYRPARDVDFWYQEASFNRTCGVECGRLDSRPAACTTGVAYWATNQPCSTVDAANVGANPATPISGTLYKCTSTNSCTAYYSPYTYPHPLRTDCINYPTLCDFTGDTRAPAAPMGLIVN